MKNDTELIILLVLGAIAFCALYNIFFCSDKIQEHLTDLSNEALQDIADVYSKDNMQVTKLTAPAANVSTITLNTIKGDDNNNINFDGNICAGGVCLSSSDFMKTLSRLSKNDYMYSGESGAYAIYEDIFDALSKSVVQKNGSPSGWDETSGSGSNYWNGLHILMLGNTQSNPNGLLVNVPANMSVIWLRALNERWLSVKLYDNDNKYYGSYATGYRNLNTIAPDGGTPNQHYEVNKWFPIGLPPSTSARKFIIVGGPNGNYDCWIAGIAFSTNPWNHAMNSAVTYHWKLNGSTGVSWHADNWNNEQLGQIDNGQTAVLYVPCIYTGKDKLVYLIGHNDVWDTLAHFKLTVNDKPIERFRTTYDNPFARHYNSKPYQRYVAALVPASLTSSDLNFIKLSIDMTKQNITIFFREVGTHDAY